MLDASVSAWRRARKGFSNPAGRPFRVHRSGWLPEMIVPGIGLWLMTVSTRLIEPEADSLPALK